ncbi:MAG: dCMP deaminase family protein [Chloroflexota bacterium]|nr:dCMP deaminase family protein [Chloroflexota bacterium]
MHRRSWDDYFMNKAWVASSRANCSRIAVGALLVVDQRIISTGYNGTPFGIKNCVDGGCPRCASNAPRHQGYDFCLCVHAEQNAITLAARHGTVTDRATLYTTLRPCFNCLILAIQAGVEAIVYDLPFDYDENLEAIYQTLVVESSILMRRHPYAVPLEPFNDQEIDFEPPFNVSNV